MADDDRKHRAAVLAHEVVFCALVDIMLARGHLDPADIRATFIRAKALLQATIDRLSLGGEADIVLTDALGALARLAERLGADWEPAG